ncbi:2858_t:CDS:2, partial [Acaulospora colombiana]
DWEFGEFVNYRWRPYKSSSEKSLLDSSCFAASVSSSNAFTNALGAQRKAANRAAAAAVKDTDDGSGGIIITPAAGADVEKGEFTQTHPSPFAPNYQTTPASPYQIPEKQGEAQDYFNQPYGQGGMGYTFNQMNEVPQAATPSVGYTSRPTTPHHHGHTYSGSQVHLMGSPPVGYR